MASVTLRNISKVYGSSIQAVKATSLEILDKEFLVLVGPSGCGKTTILRLISGLEEATTGDIFIDSRHINDVSPKDRDIAMIFQNYALYPHMSVYENMAFGLKLRKIPKNEIERRVQSTSQLLEIQNLLDRKPRELSGGQRQRVAMGRAIVREPKVFLMDEPLSNLDAKLRVQMRVELQKLHQRLGITTIYVTHDQTEAMTLGSRIVVMKDGFIQQIDSPIQLYEKPVNLFVATFIGSPPMNLAPVKLAPSAFRLQFTEGKIEIDIPQEKRKSLEPYQGKEILFGIRPEDIQVGENSPYRLDALVEVVELLGSEAYLHVRVGQESWVARVSPQTRAQVGAKVPLALSMQRMHAFDPETGKALL